MAADLGVKSQLLDDELKEISGFAVSTTSEATTEFRSNTTLLKMHPTSCDLQLQTGRVIYNQSGKDEDDSSRTSTVPPGWTREVRQRKTGKTAGKLDVYIIR